MSEGSFGDHVVYRLRNFHGGFSVQKIRRQVLIPDYEIVEGVSIRELKISFGFLALVEKRRKSLRGDPSTPAASAQDDARQKKADRKNGSSSSGCVDRRTLT